MESFPCLERVNQFDRNDFFKRQHFFNTQIFFWKNSYAWLCTVVCSWLRMTQILLLRDTDDFKATWCHYSQNSDQIKKMSEKKSLRHYLKTMFKTQYLIVRRWLFYAFRWNFVGQTKKYDKFNGFRWFQDAQLSNLAQFLFLLV